MNDLQTRALTMPHARAGQIGLPNFKALKHSPYRATIGVTLNR